MKVRRAAQVKARDMGFGLTDQTRIMTAASELARNTVTHGRGGTATMEEVTGGDGRRGLRIAFEDRGPGIADAVEALRDGYSTGRGLGKGLGGAGRLVDDLEIESAPEQTRVVMTRWLR